ncbi:MAG: DUF188 domain-containing protein [Erysipelotrichaceae bacterium]
MKMAINIRYLKLVMNKILIDADGSPIINECINIANDYGIDVHIISDYNHVFNYPTAYIHQVDKGNDSADYALLNLLNSNDLVITQDYGLATLALSKKAYVLNNNGIEYNNDNIIEMLSKRAAGAAARKHKNYGGNHQKKRTKEANIIFASLLKKFIEETYKMDPLKQINEASYAIALKQMSIDEINAHLLEMNVTLDYNGILEKLKVTYNDLSVADFIFSNYEVKASKYPIAFIDSVVFEIVKRNKFDFKHYGLIIDAINGIEESDISEEHKASLFKSEILSFIKLCQRFKLVNFDAIMYEVNDGFDFQTFVNDYFDECKELGVNTNSNYLNDIIDISKKLLNQFTSINEYFEEDLNVVQASAYVALKNPLGEKLFFKLMKNTNDVPLMNLYYGLSFIDVDKIKCKRLLSDLLSKSDKNSDVYKMTKNILDDLK